MKRAPPSFSIYRTYLVGGVEHDNGLVGKLELGDEELSLPSDLDLISDQNGLLDVEVNLDPSREEVVLVIEVSSQISSIRGFCKCVDFARA